MKKIVSIFMVVIILTLLVSILTGCGNVGMIGSYNFEWVHTSDQFGDHHFVIEEEWYENSAGVEIESNGNNYFFSEGSYIMGSGSCPFCSD